MPELKTEIKSYRVTFLCEECNEGDMVYTGMELTSNPPWYTHRCNKCGEYKNFRRRYPGIVYS